MDGAMTTPIETLASYLKTTAPIVESVLETEFRELEQRVARWRYDTGHGVALEDRHLIGWKEGRGPKSAELVRHPKAGPAWLALAREAVANV